MSEKKNAVIAVAFALLIIALAIVPGTALPRLAQSEMSPAQEEVRIALEEYYFAFISEKMDPYLETQFLAHLSPEQLAEKKSRIEAIWASFDSGFAIDTYNSIGIDEDVAIVEYILNSVVKDLEGNSESSQTEYTAILFRTPSSGWKVYSAKPRAISNFEALLEGMSDAKEEAEIYQDLEVNSSENPVEENFTQTTTVSTIGNSTENPTQMSCSPDTSFLSNFSVPLGANSEAVGAIIGDNKTVSIEIGNATYFAKVEGETAFSIGAGEPDFDVSIDPCAYERIYLGGNPKLEYDSGAIKVSARSFGDSLKITIANIFNFFYGLFKKEPFEMWLEAESGKLSGKSLRYSFIGPTSRGPGELYLGDGGAYANYSFQSKYPGTVHIYLRVSDDGLHPDGARSASFSLNGKALKYSHKSAKYYPWGMEYLGEGELAKGENSLSITKDAQTSAAFTLDKILFSEKKRAE